jgi:hypothetical protein
MHLEVILKLKKKPRNSILGKYKKNTKKKQNNQWAGFFLNPGFFQP